jgi:hypothetical protein
MSRLRAIVTGQPVGVLSTVSARVEYHFPDQGPPQPALAWVTFPECILWPSKPLWGRWDDPVLHIWQEHRAPPDATIPVRVQGRRDGAEWYVLLFPVANLFALGYEGQPRGGTWDGAAGVLRFTLP